MQTAEKERRKGELASNRIMHKKFISITKAEEQDYMISDIKTYKSFLLRQAANRGLCLK